MRLPTITPAQLDVRAVDSAGLPKRYLNQGELDVLVALARSVQPSVMVEVGVNEGRTACAMLRNLPTIDRYVGIDVPPGYVTSKAVQRAEIPARPGHLARSDSRFELILRPRGSLDLEPEDMPQCDVMFIDGDHGAEAVTHDSLLAWRCVRSGGIVIWHDYHDRGTVDVKPVLESFAACGHDIKHVAGTWIAFERVAA